MLGLIVVAVGVFPDIATGARYPWLNLPRAYESPEARFRIVDARNGLPIEGAWVVVSWNVTRPGFEDRPFRVVELKSDVRGEVRVPAWGPAPMPPGGFIPEDYPAIRVFRPGHIVAASSNVDVYRASGAAAPSVIRIRLDGTDVRLLPQDADSSAYVEKLEGLYRWLNSLKGWGDPPKGSADEATRAVMKELIEVAPDFAEAYSMKEQLEAEGIPPLTGVQP